MKPPSLRCDKLAFMLNHTGLAQSSAVPHQAELTMHAIYQSHSLYDGKCWSETGMVCCRPATENANAETRGSADVICRAARSVAQGASDLETFLLKRFPLAMPVENNWQSDPTTYSTAEAVDVLDKDPRKSVAVKNEKRQGILYNSPAASGPSMRMRSKAASCMPSLQAGGSALSALPATLQAALAFEVRLEREIDMAMWRHSFGVQN